MKILHRERIGKFSTKHVDAVRPLQFIGTHEEYDRIDCSII